MELDYDENMEELDMHCVESPKTKDGKSESLKFEGYLRLFYHLTFPLS